MTHSNGLYGERRRCGQQRGRCGKSATHLAFVLLHPSAARLVGHCPAMKSREVRAHRNITGKSGVPCFESLHSGHHAGRGFLARARARSGPAPPPPRCLARCRPITCATSSLPTAFRPPRSGDDLRARPWPEKHGGRVTERRRPTRPVVSKHRAGRPLNAPGHGAWCGRRRRSGGSTRSAEEHVLVERRISGGGTYTWRL